MKPKTIQRKSVRLTQRRFIKLMKPKNICSVCIYCAIQGVSTQTLIQIH